MKINLNERPKMGWAHEMKRRFGEWHMSRHMEHLDGLEAAGRRGGGRGWHLKWHFHRGGFGDPFGGNPFGGNPFARRARAKRGDVRAAILVLLAEAPRNGYQVMQELEQRSSGTWRPSPGSIYPAFQQLEDEGLVRVEDGGSGKVYRLTDAGAKEAGRIQARGQAPWEADESDEDDGGRAALFNQMKMIGMACMQIAHAGDEQQVKEATEALSGVRKALYTILAEDSPEE